MQHQQYAEERGLLGSLCSGQKKLEGKTFYLDDVKKRPTALLLEAIPLLGGRVESFLHRDVSFVVTGSQEGLKDQKDQKCTDTKPAATSRTSEEAQHPIMQRGSVLSSDKRRPGTPRPVACGSRGKALLEKAIRNNERLQRNSVLASARSWGVKILYVDDVVLYLKQLNRESFSAVHKKPEKTCTKQGSHVVKAAALRSPYLKIEDLSRKHKPLHMQSMTFPTLWYSGRFSPFECPPPPRFEKRTEQGEDKTREKKKVECSLQDKSQTPLSCSPSPWRPRKKDTSYCECCHQPFANLEEHLQSDQHRAFVLDLSNYSVVDQLVAEMLPGFDPNPPQQSEEAQPPTPLPFQDVCELEPLTDVETEHAVQALQRQSSSFSAYINNPPRGPLSPRPTSPSPGPQIPFPSPTTPPADIQPFTADCQLHPRTSSPAMPVLDVEPQANCPDTPCPSPDPYSLPPVLSPQVPYPSSIMEPRCLYSDPPVLSPQWYTAEEAAEGHTCEMDTAESASQSVTVPLSAPLLPSVELTNAEGVKGSNQDSLSGLKHRSWSLPQRSAAALNPKKRCRSVSPEHTRSKKRKVTANWTEQGCESKPGSDIMVKPEDCLLFDEVSCPVIQSSPNPKVSSARTVDDLKQTFNTFCVPTVQNFTQALNQTDILGHGGPSWTLSSKAKTLDPPLQFPKVKPHSTFSSQDSQRSLSHSTSVCIESALIPDLASPSSSSDSDWDCHLLSRLGPSSAAPPPPGEQTCKLDKELLQRPCTWMHDTSYESHLHNALQPAAPPNSLCGEDMDPSAFSRTVVQIVEVQH